MKRKLISAKGLVSLIVIITNFAGFNVVNAQNNVQTILSEIEKNNKTLQVQSSILEANKLLYKIGTTHYDPTVSYDFMYGTPNAISGNQTDINIIQRFDFPTAYKLKKTLAVEQEKQGTYLWAFHRQDILYQAKSLCLELIYNNKLNQLLADKKSRTEKQLQDFEVKMEKGLGNILDVNKTKLLLIEVKKLLQENRLCIDRLHNQLTLMNGGKPILLSETTYPIEAELIEFELIEKEIEENDPILKSVAQQQRIMQKQIEVNKAMNLPKFDIGYHYQGILGQRFNGGKIGMSIPLWEYKYKVDHKKAELATTIAMMDEHRNEHYYETQNHYQKCISLKETLQEYRVMLQTIKSIDLLDKALRLGEINTLQYFVETEMFYEANKNLLTTEKEYHLALALLHKYKL